jgi:hypothetical protein
VTIQELIDQLPPQKDMLRLARAVASLRGPSRAEPIVYGIAGLLIGAGIALLFAPSPGSELRDAIGGRLEEYWRNANEAMKSNGHDAADER